MFKRPLSSAHHSPPPLSSLIPISILFVCPSPSTGQTRITYACPQIYHSNASISRPVVRPFPVIVHHHKSTTLLSLFLCHSPYSPDIHLFFRWSKQKNSSIHFPQLQYFSRYPYSVWRMIRDFNLKPTTTASSPPFHHYCRSRPESVIVIEKRPDWISRQCQSKKLLTTNGGGHRMMHHDCCCWCCCCSYVIGVERWRRMWGWELVASSAGHWIGGIDE